MFRQISDGDAEAEAIPLPKHLWCEFTRRGARRDSQNAIHRTWMSHAIKAHNNRLATTIKMIVLRPLQRSGGRWGGGVGVRSV